MDSSLNHVRALDFWVKVNSMFIECIDFWPIDFDLEIRFSIFQLISKCLNFITDILTDICIDDFALIFVWRNLFKYYKSLIFILKKLSHDFLKFHIPAHLRFSFIWYLIEVDSLCPFKSYNDRFVFPTI